MALRKTVRTGKGDANHFCNDGLQRPGRRRGDLWDVELDPNLDLDQEGEEDLDLLPQECLHRVRLRGAGCRAVSGHADMRRGIPTCCLRTDSLQKTTASHLAAPADRQDAMTALVPFCECSKR